ncbi:putative phospholipid hydroperoxide glutathione peroxidase [Halotydeus destructor]|nr:putative phospholipid hydroperoxide glutathione peroxidase [Halotydeus destructor]
MAEIKDESKDMKSVWKNAKSIYEFSANTLSGETISLEKYRGYVVLAVNVASNCGLTTQNYKELNELHDKLHDKGLRIAGFPCNQFMGQEPACGVDLEEFMKKKKVEFDIYDKVDVNGDNAHPLWKYMKDRKGSLLGSLIKWNFSKFLIDRDGQVVNRYAPTTSPKAIESDIIALLEKKE